MLTVKRGLIHLVFILSIGFVGTHEALAQNGAITNPGPQPVVITPVVEPVVVTGLVGIPVIPNVIQPQSVIAPTVNPNAVGITDPLGNPYRSVNPNPLTSPIVPVPAVSPFSFPVIQTPS